ncbi:NAD(P)-dependent oxidoreductase [Streptomyces sp. Ag109_O5-10]|uniref:NAD(P)-dependent oxidoreductase n=1 Tax=Streptomyces sp. Ag109_O5-10 TaxID=1855349 RepID=UPI00089A5A8F|nr:NAD(P)-dependent oxidoreductase [Streptomyces sp. Ag109_O5-10]SEF17331.1 3-hydroxyisobutyrate dehydrogenase [Streptomyces sp. Ag109_O5-10]
MPSRVALIGAGRMGTPLCGRLVSAGHAVTAFDLRPEREAAVRSLGADWAPSAATAAAGADVLVTVVPGPDEAAAALEDAVFAALATGAVWIDMTSNAPAVARELRKRAGAHGVDVLEAPMGGGPDDAEQGRLRLFVGGSADVLDRCRPLLEAVTTSDRIRHMGGPGTGYTTKLLINLLWFGQATATAEVLLLGRRAGIDLTALHGTLAGSAAGSDFIRRDLPALFAGDYLRSYGLDRIHDQLKVITEEAQDLGTPHEMADTVLRIHRQALERFGPVDGELLAVALLEEAAGTLLRP